MIPNEARVQVDSGVVTFKIPAGMGWKTIRIYLLTSEPRIMAYCETPHGREPMSLFRDEVLEYIQEAERRLEM